MLYNSDCALIAFQRIITRQKLDKERKYCKNDKTVDIDKLLIDMSGELSELYWPKTVTEQPCPSL